MGIPHEAMEQLYEKYALLLWKIAYAALNDKELAEQAVQLVFQEVGRSHGGVFAQKKQSVLLVKLCREKILYIQMASGKKAWPQLL